MWLTMVSLGSRSSGSLARRSLRVALPTVLAIGALAGVAMADVGGGLATARDMAREFPAATYSALPYAAALATATDVAKSFGLSASAASGSKSIANRSGHSRSAAEAISRPYAGLPATSCGIGLAAASPVRWADEAGRERGVLIASVAPESPAAKAGLRVHDVVIRYDHHDIYSPEQLMQLVGERTAGEVVVTFLRGGNELETKMTLGPTPALGLAGGAAGGVAGGVEGGVAGGTRLAWTSEFVRRFPWALPETWRAWFDADRPSFQSASTRR